MAYTIVKTDGTVLTTIPDGTINTTTTSLALPGRNYAGYGQSVDTNFVHQVENFADATPPSNPLRGQLWFNTNNSTLYVCPTDGEANALAWIGLASTSSGGNTSFGGLTVTGNVTANNISVANNANANAATFAYLTVTANANIADANVTTANIGTMRTTVITTGATTTTGTMTGTWTVNGGASGNTAVITGGNLYIANGGAANAGIKSDYFYYSNGSPISFAGSYGNSNVAGYLPVYNGNILSANIRVPIITTGASGTSGTITGNWTLTAGSRLNATYADLAERFEADMPYDAGTVVEVGGTKEITAVQYELSEEVFGVISETAGYLMNATAGDDLTHPPVAVGGRVKVKVNGKVKKGQRLVSAGKGIARAANPDEITAFNVIGRALANKTTDGVGSIEAFVTIK